MRWPWSRDLHADVDAAKAALESARADDVKVDEVARRAEVLRKRNGFSEALIQAWGGRP